MKHRTLVWLMIGAGLLALFSAVARAEQAYWICVDTQGAKVAQDHPCDPKNPAKNRHGPPAGSTASSADGGSASVAAGAIDNGIPAIRVAELLAVLALFALAGAGIQWVRRFAPFSRPRDWSLELIGALEWKRFAELCGALWTLEGYRTELSARGADGDVDIRLFSADASGKLVGIIQCKPHCSQPVSVAFVRPLFENIHRLGARRGILASASEFAADAMIYAGGKPIELVDGEKLLAMINAVEPRQRSKLLKEITRGDYRTPSCPDCGKKMIRRRSDEGPVWRCRNYPGCSASFAITTGQGDRP